MEMRRVVTGGIALQVGQPWPTLGPDGRPINAIVQAIVPVCRNVIAGLDEDGDPVTAASPIPSEYAVFGWNSKDLEAVKWRNAKGEIRPAGIVATVAVQGGTSYAEFLNDVDIVMAMRRLLEERAADWYVFQEEIGEELKAAVEEGRRAAERHVSANGAPS